MAADAPRVDVHAVASLLEGLDRARSSRCSVSAVLDTCVEHLGWDYAVWWAREPGTARLSPEAEAGEAPEPAGPTDPRAQGEGPVDRAWTSGSRIPPVDPRECAGDARMRHAAACGFRRVLAQPVQSGGEPVGVIELWSRRPRRLGAAAGALLQLAADALGRRLEGAAPASAAGAEPCRPEMEHRHVPVSGAARTLADRLSLLALNATLESARSPGSEGIAGLAREAQALAAVGAELADTDPGLKDALAVPAVGEPRDEGVGADALLTAARDTARRAGELARCAAALEALCRAGAPPPAAGPPALLPFITED